MLSDIRELLNAGKKFMVYMSKIKAWEMKSKTPGAKQNKRNVSAVSQITISIVDAMRFPRSRDEEYIICNIVLYILILDKYYF